MRPIVGIVGRANVGKSTLFNRLVGKQRAIVHDSPGVTRDRIVVLTSIEDIPCWIVDTGGFELESDTLVGKVIREQIEDVANQAHVLIVLFDGRNPPLQQDQEIVDLLRKYGKPMVGAVNKMDPGFISVYASDYHKFGLNSLLEISAEHDLGIDQLLLSVKSYLSDIDFKNEEMEENKKTIRVAFVGRPNVGKSSLINAILKQPRLIVSDQAGTTRDVIDIPVNVNDQAYLLLDTAGIRRSTKVQTKLETYSVVRALRAIDESDVVVFLIDSTTGVTTQDSRIAAIAEQKGSGLLMVVNKWDLQTDHPTSRKNFRRNIYDHAPFLSFGDIRFVSAKTGMGVEGILSGVLHIWKNLKRTYSTAELQNVFDSIAQEHPPSGKKGARLRLHGLSHVVSKPSLFVLSCNDPQLVNAAYQQYWKNQLHKHLHLTGIPLRVLFRRKRKKSK